jgi:hypothetical protein
VGPSEVSIEYGELVRFLKQSLTDRQQLHQVMWGLRSLHLYLGLTNTLAYMIQHVFWGVFRAPDDDGTAPESHGNIQRVFERCIDEGEVGVIHLCLRVPSIAQEAKKYMRRTVRSGTAMAHVMARVRSTESATILRLFLEQETDPAWCTELLAYAASTGNVSCLVLLLDLARTNPRINPGVSAHCPGAAIFLAVVG